MCSGVALYQPPHFSNLGYEAVQLTQIWFNMVRALPLLNAHFYGNNYEYYKKKKSPS